MFRMLLVLSVFSIAAWGCMGGHQNGKGHSGHDHAAHSKKSDAPKDGYPLDVCVVSGKKLGSMGDPVVINHNGQTVKFCCNGCVKMFNKDPEKYMSKLEAAK